ncbi:MAG: YciI family protein [Methylobacter sp.]|nr:YciI family protein [Methylobacter sp.]
MRPPQCACAIVRLLVTDGPFAETKEQLAGFYLLEARDLNEAIQLAGRIPPARFGSIEVRPIREFGSESERQIR